MWTRTAGLPDCSEPGMGMLSPQVRRTSVLRSKTLAQGEFISPEHFDPKGPPRGLTRGEVMPGLPKVPAAEKIDVDEDGRITGLFLMPGMGHVFAAGAAYKRFAQQNLGAGRIHFARAF